MTQQARSPITNTVDLSGETAGTARRVFDDFWVLASAHHPGGSQRFPEINNRALIFRLLDQGAPVLVVVNAVDPELIPQVKALETETGTAVRYLVSPGGGHHLFMRAWHDAFEAAQVLLGPVRAPRTANGKALMQLPRVTTMDLHNPLPQFSGQLDAVMFHGLYSLPDQESAIEGGADSMWSMVKAMFAMMTGAIKDPVDELWLFHKASGTVIGGENLGWMYPSDVLAKQGMMLKQMVKPDTVHIFTDPRKVGDAKRVQECWRAVLAWPARTVMSYHDVPAYARQRGCHEELQQAVFASGQLTRETAGLAPHVV